MHASRLARDLGIQTIVVPRLPGTLSAFGLAMSDIVHDYTTTMLRAFDTLQPEQIATSFADMESTARQTLATEGVPAERVQIMRSADMRYVGQLHELNLPVGSGQLTREDIGRLLQRFHSLHETLYGFNVPEEPVMLIALRLRAVGEIERPRLPLTPRGSDSASGAVKGERQAFFEECGGFVSCCVYEREMLRAGDRFEGPALVEQMDSTTVVLAGQRVLVDDYGSLIVQES